MVSNSRAKGNRNQRKLMDLYESLGFKVSKVELGGKFTKEKDLFGLFDLVAFKGSCVHFIQVTTNRPHTHKGYIDFAKEHAYTNIIFKQYVWYDRKGWKSFTYTKKGEIIPSDQRK